MKKYCQCQDDIQCIFRPKEYNLNHKKTFIMNYFHNVDALQSFYISKNKST